MSEMNQLNDNIFSRLPVPEQRKGMVCMLDEYGIYYLTQEEHDAELAEELDELHERKKWMENRKVRSGEIRSGENEHDKYGERR